jgi:putative nucleotidyltransferase with HDIG domain
MEQRYSDFIIRLANGISQRQMYFDTHPRVLATGREVAEQLTTLARETGEDALSVGIYGGRFVRNGHYLVGPSIAGRALIDFAGRLGCGGFTFSLPLAADDINTFFRLGADRSQAYAGLAEAQAAFVRHGLSGITLARPLCEDIEDDDAESAHEADGAERPATDFTPLVGVYQDMYDAVSTNALTVGNNGAIDISRALAAGQSLVDLTEHGALDVMQFLRYPDYDSYTIGHSVRVAALSAMVARALGWPEHVLAELAAAGLLHDLGKGRIPPEILFKPGRLDDEERRIIETHPELGARLLLDNGESSALILSATWGHHLRHDGGGYPLMPAWHLPGIVAELVHVCDVFEALTALRPYKRPMSPRHAFELMLREESAFHPRLLATLIDTLGLYPPGSEVQLSDARTAVVVGRGTALDRPVLRITRGMTGQPVARDVQPTLDLAGRPDLEIVEIVSVGMTGEALPC